MKKIFASLFVAGLLLSGVVGCGGTATTAASKDGVKPAADSTKPKADEKKADEKKADEKKADEKKADEKKADEKKADEKKPE